MNSRGFLIVILLFACINGFAQRSKTYTANYCGSVVLKDVADKYNVSLQSLEMPEIEGDAEEARLREIKAQSAARFPHKVSLQALKTTSAAMPILATNFVADSFTGIPPDNYMAISLGKKAVSVINQSIAIHDGNTGNYLYKKTLGYFSSPIGLHSTNDNKFDPKVMYDPEADKFICVMLNGINQYNYIVVAFSATNDPAGTWHFYKFYGDYTADTTWFDYPAISMTKNEFFLTGNKIKFDSSWQAGFKQTLIYQLRKQDGYSGSATVSYTIWDSISYNGKNLRCLHPVKPGYLLEGPAQYFLSNRNFDVLNDTVFLVKVSDTIGGGGGLTVTPLVSSLSYGVPPNGRQTDTNYTLATNDGRILGAFVSGNEIQFVNTSVNPLNGSSSVYHGIIANYNSSPTLTGHIYSFDSLDLGYPNISYTGYSGTTNQSIITFNYTGPNTNPGFGAAYFDGSSYSNMLNIKSGEANIHQLAQKEQRWGDYSGSQPDWGMVGSVWCEGIYGKNLYRYGCYMAQLYSPNFTGVKAVKTNTQTNLFPNPAMEYVKFEFSIARKQHMDFVICDVQGRVVDKLLSQVCEAGKNVIEFNIASLAPGTYLLKGKGEQGELVEAGKFIRK